MPVARTQRTRHHGLLRSPRREVTCSCPEHHKAPRKCDSVRRRGIVSLPRLLRGPRHALMCPGGKAPQGAYVDSTESGTGTRTSERSQPHRADRPHRPLGRPAPPSPLQDEAPPHGTNRPRMMKPFIPQAITASASSQAHIEKHQHTHLYYPWRISNDECRSVS